ncbi:MAG: sodium-type flagellar protein MotY [Methyloprofundus sp.]|nr:MAG: sodium-type flagellar protein MotY [Methyloprofundus sp.]
MFKFYTVILSVLIFNIGLPLSAAEYSADILKAYWESKSSKMACDLTQPIPNYGEAFFSIRPEQPLQFGIYQLSSPRLEVGEANLSALPAPWRHEFTHLKTYPVYIDQQAQTQYLSVFGADAEAMINVLLSTEFPTFTYINTHQGTKVEDVRVSVSAINFVQPYKNFMACRQQLLPYTMATLQDKVVYFAEKSTQVNVQSQANFVKIAQYMQEMPASKLVIASDTHIVGKRDAKLFKPRAKKVVKFLVKQGINKSRISIQSSFSTAVLQDKNNTFRVHIFGPDVLKMFWYHKGSIKLTRKERQYLDLVALYMQYQTKPLIIKSHTDGMGRRAKNQVVSQKRGDAVKLYLQKQGVPAEKVVVRAYGERKPVASNRTRKGQAKNRRVELRFAR